MHPQMCIQMSREERTGYNDDKTQNLLCVKTTKRKKMQFFHEVKNSSSCNRSQGQSNKRTTTDVIPGEKKEGR